MTRDQNCADQDVAFVFVVHDKALVPHGEQIPRAAYSAGLQAVVSQVRGLPVDKT